SHFFDRQFLVRFPLPITKTQPLGPEHSLKLLFERTRRNSELAKSWPSCGRRVDLHKLDLIPCEGRARQDLGETGKCIPGSKGNPYQNRPQTRLSGDGLQELPVGINARASQLVDRIWQFP